MSKSYNAMRMACHGARAEVVNYNYLRVVMDETEIREYQSVGYNLVDEFVNSIEEVKTAIKEDLGVTLSTEVMGNVILVCGVGELYDAKPGEFHNILRLTDDIKEKINKAIVPEDQKSSRSKRAIDIDEKPSVPKKLTKSKGKNGADSTNMLGSIITQICEQTDLGREQVEEMIDEHVKKVNGLLTPVGAALIVADKNKVVINNDPFNGFMSGRKEPKPAPAPALKKKTVVEKAEPVAEKPLVPVSNDDTDFLDALMNKRKLSERKALVKELIKRGRSQSEAEGIITNYVEANKDVDEGEGMIWKD